MTTYAKRLPQRDYKVQIPKRVFQSISDTVHRQFESTIPFTSWGQTDITLSSVLETFGELP